MSSAEQAQASGATSACVLLANEIVETLLVSDRFPVDLCSVVADNVSEGNQLAVVDAARRAVLKSALDALALRYGPMLEMAIGVEKTRAFLQSAAESLIADRSDRGIANQLGGLLGDLRRLRDLHEEIAAQHRSVAAASTDPTERDHQNAAADPPHRAAVRLGRGATLIEGSSANRVEPSISTSSIEPRLVAVASRPACANAPPRPDVRDTRPAHLRGAVAA